MKKLISISTLLFFLLLYTTSNAQSFAWANKVTGSGNVFIYGISSDIYGNVYVTGFFTGSATFETTVLTASGYSDIFIAKYTSFGSLLWVRQAGSSTDNSSVGGDIGYAITVDKNGNSYITGQFQGSASFGTNTLTNWGQLDIFIAKYDSNGNCIWAKDAGGTGQDYGKSIFVDNNGKLYLTGIFLSAIAHFNTTQLNGGSYGYGGIFIAKYDTTGVPIWVKQVVCGNYNPYGYNVAANGITADVNGNCYVTGYAKGIVYFGAFTFTASKNSFFIAKYNSAGNEIWVNGAGVNCESSGNGISVDGTGKINVTGSFKNIAQFDTISLTGWNPNYDDIFIAKYNDNGNIIWAKKAGGNFAYDKGNAVTSDNLGNCYFTGTFSDTAYFGSTMLITPTIPGQDIFISKYDYKGDFIWVKQGHSSGSGQSITLNKNFDNIYSTGWFSDSASFDNFHLYGNNNSSTYIVKIKNLKNQIKGKIYMDIDNNCTFNSGDTVLKNYFVKASPGPYYGVSDATGNYTIFTDTGSYSVTQITNGLPLFEQSCQLTHNVNLHNPYDSVTNINFANKIDVYCPKLYIDIGTEKLSGCHHEIYKVNYCNNGTMSSNNVQIKIEFPTGITPISTTFQGTNVLNQISYFNIGTLGIHQCGSFSINVYVNCGPAMGSTKCVTAMILPDTICVQPDTVWDKRQMIITGRCIDSGFVRFIIKNIHSNNYTQNGIYRIFVNSTFALQNNYSILPHDSLIIIFPANGNTVRLKLLPNNLETEGSAITIEGCGGLSQLYGFAQQFPENVYADNYKEDCQLVYDSWDPNEKQVKPTGVTQMHYIKSYDELEYQINFQNTGNDTAFKVVITDTISPYLDFTSLENGASSHSYTFQVYGSNIAEWTFNNIMLPDSNVDSEGSNGFLKFKIQQKPNNPKGTIINNSAAIYFDFNPAVITDTTINIVNDTTLLCPEPLTNAGFTFSPTGFDVTFSNTSSDAMYYYWSFGDNSNDTLKNPIHTYTSTGLYNACLVSSNDCSCDTFCQIINVSITGIQNDLSQYFKIYPNPTHDEIIIEMESIIEIADIEILNVLGESMNFIEEKINENKDRKFYKIQMLNYPDGIYFLKIKMENGVLSKLIIVN